MTATSDVDLPDTTTIHNPATGAVAGTVRWTDPADVPRIAAGLREAQKEWEARGTAGRAKVLARYAVWLGEHRDEIAAVAVQCPHAGPRDERQIDATQRDLTRFAFA